MQSGKRRCLILGIQEFAVVAVGPTFARRIRVAGNHTREAGTIKSIQSGVASFLISIRPESEYGRSVSLASCRTHLATHGSLRNQTALLMRTFPPTKMQRQRSRTWPKNHYVQIVEVSTLLVHIGRAHSKAICWVPLAYAPIVA